MLIAESRPRNLSWLHAGPLLFGDWGTSRLYVLGLAFYYVGHASVFYLTMMSVIMAAVAWAYTVVCRCFPEGGGVYSAARQLSPTLSVIGATLLLCDYIVTAALSVVEGFHYIGLHGSLVVMASIAMILVIGLLNWFGARAAGRFALVIAIVAIAASLFIAILCLPMIDDGFRTIKTTVPGVDSAADRWTSLVRIVLALSGVEAVANMTGLMKQPVARTAKRTIWPVLIEVIVLNMIFALALNALPPLQAVTTPDFVTHEGIAGLKPENVPDAVKAYRDTAVKVLATHSATQVFGAVAGKAIGVGAGIVFGLLLFSAVNTAVMAMVSVMYSLAQDRELPRSLARLNYSGVPWIGLIVAVLLPIGVLLYEADPKALGELYAIGVVGAIAINVVSCAANKRLALSRPERIGMWALGILMSCIELTIIIAKHHATVFAASMIGAVLIARFAVKSRTIHPSEPLPEPTGGWMSALTVGPSTMPASGPRIMLAARGRDQAEYAADLAKKRGGSLFVIFVRTIRVLDVAPGSLPRVEDDKDAQITLGTASVIAKEHNVPFYPIYISSPDIANEILDYTVTFGCDTLIMGKTKRSLFARRIAGDVVAKVAEFLPDDVSLITRSTAATAATTPRTP